MSNCPDGTLVSWIVLPTPFGDALFCATCKGLCGLAFVDKEETSATLKEMQQRWPEAEFQMDPSFVAPIAKRCVARMSGKQTSPIALVPFGTPFQIGVWHALLQVNPGETISYSELARRIGKPQACRAVATAVAKNPIGFFIPCHRVIRADGTTGNYHWGTKRKAAMLAAEKSFSVAATGLAGQKVRKEMHCAR